MSSNSPGGAIKQPDTPKELGWFLAAHLEVRDCGNCGCAHLLLKDEKDVIRAEYVLTPEDAYSVAKALLAYYDDIMEIE